MLFHPQHKNTYLLQNTTSTKTLNLHEASQLLGAHIETIRRMAASMVLPAVKIGRSWRFIEQDLINYMRAQYSNSFSELSVNRNSKRSQKWPSQKEITSGGLTSHTKEKEYVKALELK
ncbi:MAG: helix-turn-helix domain-containing protein [Tatlockia sp.]|nr:helix-turn-helix domain-containing protein [Tatlockia sp.]